MAKARVAFTFESVTYTLQSNYPDPASRFRNWLPDRIPIGDAAHVLSNEQLYRFRTSWRYGCHFEIPGIFMGAITESPLDIAQKLKAHLLDGGTCAVFTEDALGSTYPTCGVWPDTVPEIVLADRRNIEHTMRLSLINLAASPVEMTTHYLSYEAVAYFMDAGGGLFTLGTGNKAGEATAFLDDLGGGVYGLDSSSATEDRPLYVVDPELDLVA